VTALSHNPPRYLAPAPARNPHIKFRGGGLDRRARLVRVAARGREAIPVAAAAVAAVEAEWAAHLGEQRMAELRRILGELREITDPYA
jgi:DNA-binding MarR family transcriptional regulator